MRRIFGDFAYGPGPRTGCWWDETGSLPDCPPLDADLSCDVAVIGAGFTGLNAALELAARGRDVIVLEAEAPGSGASGRNGGFCCLGGGKLDDAALDRQFGEAGRREWRRTELAAVRQVDTFLAETGADVDRHSQGETWLAHRARDMRGVEAAVAAARENYGAEAEVHDAAALDAMGLKAGFHGGLTLPVGFALNPRKYVGALLDAARGRGVRIFGRSPVAELREAGGAWTLHAGGRVVTARQVLVATNGYSSEDLPGWFAGRYMPAQSTIVVSRPLTAAELAAQGWTSHQMVYDSRNLLHYFRLMPDNRMLFGMRGGIGASPAAEARARARVGRDFRAMFPAWAEVELTHAWSGFVCLAARFLPHVGPVPGAEGLWAAMCYHGNGVAMGSRAGKMAGALIAGEDTRPAPLRTPARRFPLGRWRRALMPLAYARYWAADL